MDLLQWNNFQIMERWYTLDSSYFSSLLDLLSFSYFLLSAKSWVIYSHKVNWTCRLDQTEMGDGNTVYLVRNMIGPLRFQEVYRRNHLFIQLLSLVWLFVTPRTVACQAHLSMRFPRQEYWSGLPFPSPGYPPRSGIEPMSPASSALAGRFFTTLSQQGSPGGLT